MGRIKVCDFGVARKDESGSKYMTMVGTMRWYAILYPALARTRTHTLWLNALYSGWPQR